MRSRWLLSSGLAGLITISLAACSTGGAATPQPTLSAAQSAATSAPAAQPTTQAAVPTVALSLGVSGTGVVLANQSSDLVFQVQGIVNEVFVQEGDVVTKGQVLARLDTRTFDQQIQQAEASLASANAQEGALNEPPKAYDVRAAQAQLQAAQAALAQAQAGPKNQDVENLRASVTTAQTNLQATKDRLSIAKTQSESQMQQLTDALTQAQASYAKAKSDWEYVQSTGNNPSNPTTTNAQGKAVENQLSDSSRQTYYTAFVQSEASMRQLEKQVDLAVKAFDAARQSEVTGIEVAEQQVVQAQAALDKLLLPKDQDVIAQAQSAVVQAQAARQRLNPSPSDSTKAQVAAGIAQAQAALNLAQINRERAELIAPYDGTISLVNVDPGDPSSVSGGPAVQIVDTSKLKIDANISDIDIAKLKLGQKVQVYADALPDKQFTGSISYIAPSATVSGNIRTYLVRIVLDDQTDLRDGMSVRVEIATQ